MGKKNPKVYRLSISEDESHRLIRSLRITPLGIALTGITTFVVVLGALYALIAFTPLRTTIPGYPDAHFRREAVNNAIKIDSLESAITRWKLFWAPPAPSAPRHWTSYASTPTCSRWR